MLPPGLENRTKHKYGQLIIKTKALNVQTAPIECIEVSLLGMRSAQRRQISIDESAEFIFSIGTNLWHFYAYLNDARVVNIRLIDVKGKVYTCEMHFNLTPTRQVLTKNPNNIAQLFKQNSYLQDCANQCQVFDNKYSKVGYATVELNLSFDEAINRTLLQANLIDFQDILVIDEISPISSKIDLNNVTAQIQEIVPIQISSIKQPLKVSSVPESLRHLQEQLKILQPSSVPSPVNVEQIDDPTIIEDEKKIEDDIDRLIAQMQNRPYDSSKYMQQVNEPTKKQNFNFTNLSLATAKSQSNQKRSDRVASSQKIPIRLPPMMKTVNNRSDFSVSPHSKLVHPTSQTTIRHSPMKPLNKTQQINRNQSNYTQIDKKSGLFKLKIHQFTMSRMERELSLLLKIYLNEDSEQFYTINGMRQGETISFNSNIKINQKREINSIKFILIDTYDMKTIFAHGIFEMNRLFSLSPTKGIFMVNLLSPAPLIQNQSKIIRMEEQSLVRVTPNLKNLRIQLEYEQSIQIIQIYLGLSEFSSACRKIRYKIPFTKESIQFRVSELNNNKHINIFPHNRSSSNKANDKMIIQLWGDSQLIGFNEISLKPISNTNQSIINSSLQPIFLYDQSKQVKDLKSGKSRASYWLKLYYGNISQVQNILNRDDRERKPEKPKTPVEVENHLGIYIKQTKVKKQVQIQVDEVEMSQTWKGSQKNILSLQQQELPDDEEDLETHDQKLNISENQFISKSMEEKYLSKQTLPILSKSKQPSNNQSKLTQFSKTIKQKPLKSLTKQFQDQIKLALIDFATEQALASLKQQCNSHLLFHFIEVQMLISIMKKLGINQKKIDFILQDVILVSNDMINVNIMYDMILGLMLEGQVKEKLIDDAQIGRYCLMTLYKNQKQEQEEEFLFDDNTQFDESRKVFQKIEYKLTMREFNLIHTYIKRQKQNQNLNDKKIRQQLLNKHMKDMKQKQIKQVKQQQIISKLYKQEWEEDDDFFIRNINQNVMEQQISHSMNKNQVSLRSKDNQNDNTCSFHGTITKQSQKMQESLLNPIQYNKVQVSKISQEISNVFKPSTQRLNPNFKLIIQGFQSSCIETIQCLLNTSLKVPRLRVVCLSEQQQQKEFWISKTSQIDQYELQLYVRQEFLDGSIELYDSDQCVARCNMSIMANMKSCYTLKHVETFEYCGILNLLLAPL